jgi:hypothetical protein
MVVGGCEEGPGLARCCAAGARGPASCGGGKQVGLHTCEGCTTAWGLAGRVLFPTVPHGALKGLRLASPRGPAAPSYAAQGTFRDSPGAGRPR